MWVLKKFFETDIIGKIYILMFLFIVVVATMTVVTRNNKAKMQQVNVNTEHNQINQI